ncbi:hypothetical protein BPOR_0571g00030 [Botrytis porri]|uniref:Uncharacterized protein n=1 Tax=Botrytis porri TaxID=87229 RepID=A0A4Z1KQQ9_9HELO|nr:hypothetical protein BPOR_0571g00030 [Botrytis porri]
MVPLLKGFRARHPGKVKWFSIAANYLAADMLHLSFYYMPNLRVEYLNGRMRPSFSSNTVPNMHHVQYNLDGDPALPFPAALQEGVTVYKRLVYLGVSI